MKNNIVIVTTQSSLEEIIGRVFDQKIIERESYHIEPTYNINQVAKMLKRSHNKITKLVDSGILKSTSDRQVYDSSIANLPLPKSQ